MSNLIQPYSRKYLIQDAVTGKRPDVETVDTDGRVDKDASHYRMDHPRRGVAAIFDQASSREGRESEQRIVTMDINSLCRTFNKLCFEIETFHDLSFHEVECALEELSQRNHSDSDCFVLIYLSRGAGGKLKARDKFFDVNCLWGCFTAERSPTLANKPKVFIVHAYHTATRASKQEGQGVYSVDCAFLEDPDETENSYRLRSYYIPDRADFLITLSTIPGVMSSRNCKQGSCYVQTLCDCLDRLGFNYDMITILTEVNRLILKNFNKVFLKTPTDSCKKQLPTIISLLIRILQFTKTADSPRGKKTSEFINSGGNSDEEEYEEVIEDAESLNTINGNMKVKRKKSLPPSTRKYQSSTTKRNLRKKDLR